MESSIKQFRTLSQFRHDAVTKGLLKGLELVVDEGRTALETLSDPRAIAAVQGRVALARTIIKAVSDTPKANEEKTK